MPEMKYDNCLVQKPSPVHLELQGKTGKDTIPGVKTTHLMSADESVQKGFFHVDCTWLWSGGAKEPAGESHTHKFSQVIGLVGGTPADPHDLGGEITIWLDGHKETITRTVLIFIPAGIVHGPILISKVARPIFFIDIAMTGKYSRTPATQPKASAAKKYAIMDHTKERFSVGGDFKEVPHLRTSTVKSSRILHIEDDMVSGAFYVDFVWIWSGTGGAPAPEHTHEWSELIAFAGADPANPRNIGGEMSIVLGEETHRTNKSTLVCIPKRTLHCPWLFHDIKKTTLVFSAGPQGEYSGSHKKPKDAK
ncbi:MAG: hypothetical protein ACYDG5_07615 [Dehalococcoidales bacterium]